MSFRFLLNDDVRGFRYYQPNTPKPVKRSFEDSDEEPPYYPSSSSSSYLSTLDELSPYPESVDGVEDDLPVAPFETTQPAVNYYKELPVVRKLDWRVDDRGQPMRRELSNTRTLVAGYVRTHGQIAETPCTFCAQGKGVWRQCVVGSDAQEEKPMTQACANCRFSQRSLGSLRFAPATPERAPAQIIKLEDGDNKSEVYTGVRVETKEPRTPSRHDGKIIPFPLDPATIGNLTLLKQAAQDLAAHLGVVKARIHQLEEEERQEKSTRNPWDFVTGWSTVVSVSR